MEDQQNEKLRATRQSPIVLSHELEATPECAYLSISWAREVTARRREKVGHATHFEVLNHPSNFLTLAGHRYDLTQLHFHSPSEHVVENRRHAGELHFVHVSPEDSRFAVIGVLIQCDSAAAERTSEKSPVGRFIDGLRGKQPTVRFNPHGLLPESRKYLRYQGSLTTPPHHETVSWIVFEQPLSANDSDLDAFAGRTDGEAHPTQPRDRRIIVRCDSLTILEPGD